MCLKKYMNVIALQIYFLYLVQHGLTKDKQLFVVVYYIPASSMIGGRRM